MQSFDWLLLAAERLRSTPATVAEYPPPLSPPRSAEEGLRDLEDLLLLIEAMPPVSVSRHRIEAVDIRL